MYIGGTDEKALHHLSLKSSTTPWTRPWPATPTGSKSRWRQGLRQRDGQWPRYSGRSPSQIQEQVRAGSHHVHVARRRQIRIKVYETSGGLHGVGVSVGTHCPNEWKSRSRASSSSIEWRSSAGSRKANWRKPAARNRRGTRVRFKPDPEISVPRLHSNPSVSSRWRARKPISMAESKFGGIATRPCSRAWRTCPRRPRSILPMDEGLPRLQSNRRNAGASRHLYWSAGKTGRHGAVEWAVAWTVDTDGFFNSYCNTIPTPDGGTHESGLRSALLRGLKDHAARVGQEKHATAVTSDDVMTGVGCMLSVFVREPEFQGQTKDRLATAEAQRSSSRRSRTLSTIGWPPIPCKPTSCSIRR